MSGHIIGGRKRTQHIHVVITVKSSTCEMKLHGAQKYWFVLQIPTTKYHNHSTVIK